MANWLEVLENTRPLIEAYGDALPSSTGLELNTVHLGRVGPELRLNLDLVEFPENPPANWIEGSNTAVLQIALTSVCSLVFDGTRFGNTISMTLERSGANVRLRIDGELLRIEACAESATVRSLVGRIDERRTPRTPS